MGLHGWTRPVAQCFGPPPQHHRLSPDICPSRLADAEKVMEARCTGRSFDVKSFHELPPDADVVGEEEREYAGTLCSAFHLPTCPRRILPTFSCLPGCLF